MRSSHWFAFFPFMKKISGLHVTSSHSHRGQKCPARRTIPSIRAETKVLWESCPGRSCNLLQQGADVPDTDCSSFWEVLQVRRWIWLLTFLLSTLLLLWGRANSFCKIVWDEWGAVMILILCPGGNSYRLRSLERAWGCVSFCVGTVC